MTPKSKWNVFSTLLVSKQSNRLKITTIILSHFILNLSNLLSKACFFHLLLFWLNFRIVDRWFIYLPKMIFSPFSSRFSSQLAHLLALKIQYFCVRWRRTTLHLCSTTRTVYNGNRKATLPLSLSFSFFSMVLQTIPKVVHLPSLSVQFARTLFHLMDLFLLSGDSFLLYLRRLHQLTLRCNKFSFFFLYCQRRSTTMLMINVGVCVSV